MPFFKKVGFIWILLVVWSVGEEDYEILFDRKQKVGDYMKFRIEGRAITENEQVVDGDFMGEQRTEKMSEADVESWTKKVDEKGAEVEGEILLKKLMYRSKEDLPLKEIAKDMALTVVDLEEGLEFYQDGKPIVGVLREALKLCAPTMVDEDKKEKGDLEDYTTNDFFGTKERKKPGDEWNVNQKAFLNEMPRDIREGMNLKTWSGKVKFREMVEVKGVRCLHLRAEVTCGFNKMEGIPEGVKLVDGTSISIRADHFLPVDLTQVDQKLKISYRVDIHMESEKAGRVMDLKVKSEMLMDYQLLDFKRNVEK